jgi:hypothetical protein
MSQPIFERLAGRIAPGLIQALASAGAERHTLPLWDNPARKVTSVASCSLPCPHRMPDHPRTGLIDRFGRSAASVPTRLEDQLDGQA